MPLAVRPAGQTGIELSALGYGCSAFWAKSYFDEAAAIRLVHEAHGQGVTYFDTGASYGNGEAERRLGRALKEMSASDVVISTKAGTVVGDNGLYKDFSAENMKRSLEGSLARLQLEQVDILYLHGPQVPDLTDELIASLLGFKTAGLVRAIGVNSFDNDVLEYCLELPLDGVMLEYNILNQASLDVANALYGSGKFVVCGTPIAQAVFSNNLFRLTSLSRVWYLLRTLKNHRAAMLKGRKFSFLNDDDRYTAAQLALAFVLRQPCFSSAVFGTTRIEHLLDNIKAASMELPEDILARIEVVS